MWKFYVTSLPCQNTKKGCKLWCAIQDVLCSKHSKKGQNTPREVPGAGNNGRYHVYYLGRMPVKSLVFSTSSGGFVVIGNSKLVNFNDSEQVHNFRGKVDLPLRNKNSCCNKGPHTAYWLQGKPEAPVHIVQVLVNSPIWTSNSPLSFHISPWHDVAIMWFSLGHCGGVKCTSEASTAISAFPFRDQRIRDIRMNPDTIRKYSKMVVMQNLLRVPHFGIPLLWWQ